METMRTKEDIAKRLQDGINFYNDRIKAWQGVKRLTKKDGSDFSAFNKNFDGASTGKYYPVEDWANPYLTVQFINTSGRYESDEICLSVDSYNNVLPKHNPDREVRRTQWGTEHEIATIEEAFTLIGAKIEQYEALRDRDANELKRLDSVFKKIEKEVEKINSIIAESNDGYYHSTLGYALRDYVNTNVR